MPGDVPVPKRLLILVAAALALAGCGGSSAPQGADDLVKYLPRDSLFVTVVDVDAARKEAQLDQGFDVLDVTVIRDAGSAESQVVTSASGALVPLNRALTFARADDPVLKAFDGTKISAAASDGGVTGRVTNAIRTSQPFSDIADALEKDGWKRDGDALIPPKVTDLARITDAGDGVVLLTGRDIDAAALVDDPPGGPAGLKDVFGTAKGSVRIAAFPKGAECVRAIGGWETANLDNGVIRLVVDGEPDAEAVDGKGLLPALALSQPSEHADDHLVEIPFTVEEEGAFRVPLSDLVKSQGYRDLYDCGPS